jgi:outer membrane protein OmpA-like peptidoglycan-associated protein
MNLPEMFHSVKLKPDIRSGIINVRDISSDKEINADVVVKNLNDKNDKVHISSRNPGKYEFNIRKDSKYSISVTLKDYFYYYAVWKADASRVGQTLDVRPVPLKEVSKIPMSNLLFPDRESTLSPEAMGELDCVVNILKNNPEYMAVISLYHLKNEKELSVAQQRARSIITFMESSWAPKTGYKIEIVPADQVKIPDINFVVNIPAEKK